MNITQRSKFLRKNSAKNMVTISILCRCKVTTLPTVNVSLVGFVGSASDSFFDKPATAAMVYNNK